MIFRHCKKIIISKTKLTKTKRNEITFRSSADVQPAPDRNTGTKMKSNETERNACMLAHWGWRGMGEGAGDGCRGKGGGERKKRARAGSLQNFLQTIIQEASL